MPVRVVEAVARGAVGLSDPNPAGPDLAEIGSAERWRQLQLLRSGTLLVAPLLAGLASGALAAEPDLLAALWARLDREAVRCLLAGAGGDEPAPLLLAARQVLPALRDDPALQQAWLEPLLERLERVQPAEQGPWLELLGHIREPRVADRLRQALTAFGASRPALASLLPLLGQQRQPQDAALLIERACDPGPLAVRRAALEGLAVGLSAWPQPLLVDGLLRLARDLDPALAAMAVDLLARLPAGTQQLRRLPRSGLDPTVAARVRRRLRASPLVLLVHGRQGGVIPEALQDLAAQLQQRRGAPVLLQTLTGAPPAVDPQFWPAARSAGAVTLVPLLLLPGEHVRSDLPHVGAYWRGEARRHGPGLVLRRQPFLGAWPAWQQLMRAVLETAAAGRDLIWLHHPLQGPLALRFLDHLERVLAQPGLAAAYDQAPAERAPQLGPAAVVAPLTLAANRLSESLKMGSLAPSVQVLPPLLELSPVREFLLASLETLP